MRNPRRTTKRERAEVRRSNPIVCRNMGIAAAARLQRQRRMRPEADQLDTVAAELQQSLEALHAATEARVAALNGHRPLASAVDEDHRMPTYAASSGYEVEPDGWVNIKYPPHISLGRLDAVDAAADTAAPDFREWLSDPNEAAELRAEAIERELDNDHDGE